MLQQEIDFDRVFQALADASRRQMVEQLSEGPASVTELARPLPMTLTAVGQHVKVLEAAGLIRTRKIGRARQCELRGETLQPVDRWIAERRQGWERSFDRLGALLAEEDAT